MRLRIVECFECRERQVRMFDVEGLKALRGKYSHRFFVVVLEELASELTCAGQALC
jgi:hypothetical protein